jgi:hypothetical protein
MNNTIQMNTAFQIIKQKINAIQHGLLRFKDKHGQISLSVKTTANNDVSMDCISVDFLPGKKFINRNVNLIQKYHDDYLYITGVVTNEVNGHGKILSISILKASWFVKKEKKSVSWLEEKYMFETESPKKAALAH